MAANEASVIYQGAFGFRNMAAATAMSTDTVFRIASMVKLLTSVAALQLVERGKLKLDEPAGHIDPTLAAPQVLTGFDAKGVPQLRAGAKTSDAAQPADAYVGLQLSAVGHQRHPLPEIRARQAGAAAHAADVRTRRAMGLWRQYRPRRPDGGNRQRAEPRTILPREHHGPARHERHRPVDHRSAARAPGQPACARRGWKTGCETAWKAHRADGVFRRRQHLFHGTGLSHSAAGVVERRPLSRRQHPAAGNRGIDVDQPDRQPGGRNTQDGESGAVERRGFFPGRSPAMGARPHDQCRSGAGRPQGRQPQTGPACSTPITGSTRRRGSPA